MKVTVVLCTYNRCELLAKALEGLATQRVSSSTEWDVLVVDNNSPDDTRHVVKEFEARYPGRFNYVLEGKQGKSNALNTGIHEATGDILAFTDDDVTFAPDWLYNLTAALVDEKWAGSGGPVLPKWPNGFPEWLWRGDINALGPFAGFDVAQEAGPLAVPPLGANMAFRKSVAIRYGGFRTDLGPNPVNMVRDEDTEFGRRLLNGGELLRWEPGAIVYHPVSDERLTREYVLSWWFAKGFANVRIDGPRPGPTIIGIPLRTIRSITFWAACWMLTMDPVERFRRKVTVWIKIGEILECRRQHRAGPQSAL